MGAFLSSNLTHNNRAFLGGNLKFNMGGGFLCKSLMSNRGGGVFLGKN